MVRSTEVAMKVEDRKWGSKLLLLPTGGFEVCCPEACEGAVFLSEDLAVQYAKERAAAMFKETEAS